MKRFTYFLVLCLFVFGNTYAQESNLTSKKFSFGIKSGLNALAVKTVNETSDFVQKKSGFYVGVFFNFPTSDVFSLQPELNYTTGDYTTNHKINLLHVPLLLKGEIGGGFSGFLGLESVFLLSLDDPNEDKFNKYMLGFTFGGAYNFSDNFSIELRPYFSFTRFLEDGPGVYRRYNTLQVGLTYKI